jgi:hypothetical protein
VLTVDELLVPVVFVTTVVFVALFGPVEFVEFDVTVVVVV